MGGWRVLAPWINLVTLLDNFTTTQLVFPALSAASDVTFPIANVISAAVSPCIKLDFQN